jgi:hypothetical protein
MKCFINNKLLWLFSNGVPIGLVFIIEVVEREVVVLTYVLLKAKVVA